MAVPYQDLLSFALTLARSAAHQIMPRFRNSTVLLKPDGTEVTDADRAAEETIRALVARRYPDHDFLGEEYGAAGSGDRPLRWIVDPIDGTAAFTMGLPTFGTLIALAEEGDPVVGVIHMPAIGETVFAARGLGCWFEAGEEPARRVTVDPVERLGQAVVSASGAHSSDIWAPQGQTPYRLSAVIAAVRKFRFVGDCLQHALVCRGRVHAGIDPVMQPWDIAALVPCIEEAGGVVGDMRGRRQGILEGGSLLSACSAPLLAELAGMLAPGAGRSG